MDPRPSDQLSSSERLQATKIDIQAKSIASERHRELNEDSIFNLPEKKALGVFDGMGGHVAGDVASRIARDHVGKGLKVLSEGLSLDQTQRFLISILKETHEKISQQARENPALRGMGTTASVVKIWEGPQGERKAVIGNVGDSRVYIGRSNGLVEQITLDDNAIRQMMARQTISLTEALALQGKLNNATDLSKLTPQEQSLFKDRNAISQALGQDNISPRIHVVDVRVGDKIIVTSDGVHDNLTDTEISKVLAQSPDNQKAVENLTEAARRRSRDAAHPRHKPDDMSAIIAEILPDGKVKESPRALAQTQPKESAPAKQESRISKATNFTELFEAIDLMGNTQGSQQTFKPAQLKRLINDVRSGRKPIDSIARSGGLREQVDALIAVDRIRAALKAAEPNK